MLTDKKNKKNQKSIKEKMTYALLIVIVLQGILFILIMFMTDVFKTIKDNSLNTLSGYLESRGNILEREMIVKTSNLNSASDHISAYIDQLEMKNNMSFDEIKQNPKIIEDILQDSVESILFLLEKQDMTGCFVLLDASIIKDKENGDSGNRAGIYIRDMEPTTVSADNLDLMLARGPIKLVKDYNISADSSWKFEHNINEQSESSNINSDFFNKPIEAARKYPNIKTNKLGYWAAPFQLNENDIRVITYSLPIKTSTGEVCGVIGIEISEDSIKKTIPYYEISKSGDGAYVMAIYNDEVGFSQRYMVNSKYLKHSFDNMSYKSNLNQLINNDMLIKLDKSTGGKTIVGYCKELKLYSPTSPFYADKWKLYAYVSEKEIYGLVSRTLKNILVAFVLSISICSLIMIFISRRLARPITDLAKMVKNADTNERIKLEKTNIIEINELSSAIEIMSADIAEAASKMSKIVEMTNLSIGAFEIKYKSDKVFITDSLFDMLGISRMKEHSNYVPKTQYIKIMSAIKANKSKEYGNVYLIDFVKDKKNIWVRIKTTKENGRMLGVIVDVTKEIEEIKKLRYESNVDHLTNLLNRKAFHEKSTEALKLIGNHCAAVMFWDIDNLKYVNDTYGHDVGDKYIQLAAAALSKFSEFGDIVARMSGDEFVVFIYGYENKNQIRDVIAYMERLLSKFMLELGVEAGNIKLRASAGVAWYPDDSANLDELLKYADFAMYEIKHSQKGFIKEFDKSTYDRDYFILQKKEIFNEFIEKEQFVFAFQPIVRVSDGKIYGYEALMRPTCKELNSPSEILILAKSQSKLYQIELLTFTKALDFISKNEELIGDNKIFVNSIPNQIFSNKDLAEVNMKYRQYTEKIVIEITESEQIESKYIERITKAAKKWNCEIAIDDFGAGYSNELSILTALPQYIKIDMSIVKGINNDENRKQLLKNIISYSSERNIKIIAEGVETKDEMDTVIELGANYLQGYYVGKPNFELSEIGENVKSDIVESYNRCAVK